jgi:hypothetical protein
LPGIIALLLLIHPKRKHFSKTESGTDNNQCHHWQIQYCSFQCHENIEVTPNDRSYGRAEKNGYPDLGVFPADF